MVTWLWVDKIIKINLYIHHLISNHSRRILSCYFKHKVCKYFFSKKKIKYITCDVGWGRCYNTDHVQSITNTTILHAKTFLWTNKMKKEKKKRKLLVSSREITFHKINFRWKPISVLKSKLLQILLHYIPIGS